MIHLTEPQIAVIEDIRTIKNQITFVREYTKENLKLDLETKLQIDIAFGEIQERLDKIKERIQNA